MNLEPLAYWVRERESVRLKKEAGEPWPWTGDPILQRYSFCCVRREDDRVTRWIQEHIREPFADHPDLWWMLCCARQINWPATLAALIEGAWPTRRGFGPEVVTSVLEALGQDKWHTGAYMIRAESDHRVPWFSWSKRRYIAEVVLGRLWHERGRFREMFAGRPKLEDVHSALLEYRGWGPFMAYQAVVDMRFTHLLNTAPDLETWAVAGPGTMRGLNRLAGRPLRSTVPQPAALSEMLEIYPVVKELVLAADFSDVPNVLCEMDKYLRVQNGEGRPRSLYKVGRLLTS